MNKNISEINMIKQQLRTGDVIDERILNLYHTLHREDFVPTDYRPVAYSDIQIPLRHQQSMLTPLEEALILQTLQLKGHETVLEIGTGTGFLTALLSKVAKHVVSVDYFEEFTERAKKSCHIHGCTNIEFITGDGCQGWVAKAPYDVIVITGAMKALTETLKLQVLLGGQLFAIIGKHPVMEGNIYRVDHNGQWTQDLVFETNTPLLIDKQSHQQFVF
ncbi:MAG: protein-L-isoaspartate O-methyltransferase [Legionella sp.]|nr:MAG: protein-L-isoaspartate O-methyltransferase [Legionella sp.]